MDNTNDVKDNTNDVKDNTIGCTCKDYFGQNKNLAKLKKTNNQKWQLGNN